MRTRMWIALGVATTVLLGPLVSADSARADPGSGTLTLVVENPQRVRVPLVGVVMTLVRQDEEPDAPIIGTTDGAGRVTFDDVTAGDFVVSAAPPDAGGATRVRTVVELQVGGLDGFDDVLAVVLPIGATVAGTVHDATAAPVAGAAVVARSAADPTVTRTATTDARGRYRLTGLASGPYAIQFDARVGTPLPAATRTGSWSFWGQPPGTPWSGGTVTVRNADAGHVRTAATAVDGEVVRGAVLTTHVRPQGTLDLGHATVTYAGESIGSTFSVPLLGEVAEQVVPGRYRVSVTAVDASGRPATRWYTGATSATSADASAAAWVTVGTAGAIVTLPWSV